MRTDSKHLALEKTRQALYILSKSCTKEDILINQLKALQATLRHDMRVVIDPYEIVSPFLALLRAPSLSGPFKLVALDAIRTFLYLLSELPEKTGEALASVVDAVTKCKFVQTDAVGDDLVQLQIILTLDDVIRSPIRCYLTDNTTLDIIRSCHSVILHTALTGSTKSSVYQAAEKTLLGASRFVFTCAAAQNSRPITNLGHGPGAVCAVEVMSFFLSIMQKHSIDAGKGKGGTTSSSLKRHQVSSVALSALNDAGLSPEMQELLLALKAISVAFLGDGDFDACRELIMSNEPLACCIRNDLGRCLTLLSSRRDLPLSVLQSVLGLFSFTRQLLGPTVKILVECFMRYVYVKALLQVRVVFANHDESMRILADPTQAAASGKMSNSSSSNLMGSGSSSAANSSSASFSTDELEIVLESLTDLLADPSFIPSLFASFDCDPTKADIVQPLVKYLGTCKRYTLVAEPHEMAAGGILEIGALVEQCYEQLLINLMSRVSATGTPQASCEGPRPKVSWEDVATHLRLTRLAKDVLFEGATLFARKPQEGLRFLQMKGALPNPLTPVSVATFLRIAPGLPKESAGAFLGELGKDNPSYEADGKAFHREVLLSYVQSFELKGQSVLNCLRIFLSAFRLPGEAQQIDRILVAFSEICHAACIEGCSGLIENPEVTYLLTFSMIMLNTDLHNPNIRADRRMTTDQFVKNNAFYGKELNQTMPLPRDFLESIYDSLAGVPIRTERNDLGASITPEMWMDLQLQSSIEYEKGLMITTGYPASTVEKLRRSSASAEGGGHASDASHDECSDSSTSGDGSAVIAYFTEKDVAAVARNLLVASEPPPNSMVENGGTPEGTGMKSKTLGALELTACIFGAHWLVDEDLLSCILQDLVGVTLAPFFVHRFIVAPTLTTVAPAITSVSHSSDFKAPSLADAGGSGGNYWRRRQATPRSLRKGVEITLELLELLRWHNMNAIVDSLVLLLIEVAGLALSSETTFSSAVLGSLNLLDFVPAGPEFTPMGGRSPTSRLKLRGDSDNEKLGVVAPLSQASDAMVELLLTSIASRTALGLVLTVFVTQPASVGRRCWQAVWLLLAMLRDCTLLPGLMVADDGEGTGDSDLLPPVCRAEFEMRLKVAEIKALQTKQKERSRAASTHVKKSSSLLSFQGFGEAIFGTSSISDASSEDAGGSGELSSLSLSRWDTGYEEFVEQHHHRQQTMQGPFKTSTTGLKAASSNHLAATSDNAGQPNSASTSGPSSSVDVSNAADAILRGEKDTSMFMSSPVYEDKESIVAAFSRLKTMVEACGIAQLVPDTRLLGDEILVLFTETLISITEAADGFLLDLDAVRYGGESTTERYSVPDSPVASVVVPESTPPIVAAPKASSSSSRSSSSSVSAIDRYTDALKTISGKTLSVVVSKSVSASSVSWLEMMLASVCSRNRDRFASLWPLMSVHYRNTLLNAKKLTYSFERRVTGLLKITARAMVREAYTTQILDLYRLFVSPCKVNSDSDDAFGEQSSGDRNQQLSSLRASLLADVACQISSGMWRLLTRNVQTLTSLSLEQWQIVFDVIAVGASAGGYASIKAFETVAWLLHEPRLLANVPVFIVISIRPLLGNPRVPVSVSVGAVKLLCHLHSRLEVLISSEDEDYVDVTGGDASSSVSGLSPQIQDRDHDGHDSDTPVLWESCWTPILRLLADAAGDSRVAVRNAASNALSRCILDRHIRAVPPGVLVNVLGDILVPVILLLGEEMIRERDTGNHTKQQPVEAMGQGTAGEVAFLGEVASYGREVLLRSAEQDGSKTIPVIECMTSLCFVFEEQIKRLSTFPTFDKLVLRLLHVFGYFLGAPHGFSSSSSSSSSELDDRIKLVVTAAGEHLTAILTLLHNLGVFKHRSGLWVVTKESLAQFANYQLDLS